MEIDDLLSEYKEKRIEEENSVWTLNFVKLQGGPPQGQDVEVKVKGDRFEQLSEIADRLKVTLSGIDGVEDIRDDFRIGKSELRIYLKREKAAIFGMSTLQVSQTVRTAIEGAKSNNLSRSR